MSAAALFATLALIALALALASRIAWARWRHGRWPEGLLVRPNTYLLAAGLWLALSVAALLTAAVGLPQNTETVSDTDGTVAIDPIPTEVEPPVEAPTDATTATDPAEPPPPPPRPPATAPEPVPAPAEPPAPEPAACPAATMLDRSVAGLTLEPAPRQRAIAASREFANATGIEVRTMVSRPGGQRLGELVAYCPPGNPQAAAQAALVAQSAALGSTLPTTKTVGSTTIEGAKSADGSGGYVGVWSGSQLVYVVRDADIEAVADVLTPLARTLR